MRYLCLWALMGALWFYAADAHAGTDTQLTGGGLSARTADGKFAFTLRNALQGRYTFHDTRGQGSSGDNGRDFSNFRITIARTMLEGHLFALEFQYQLHINWAAGNPMLENFYFRWAPHPAFNLNAGQLRLPVSWEHLVGGLATSLPDKAIADQAFHQGWGKGVSVSGRADLYEATYDTGVLWWEVGVYNGVLASPDGSQGRGVITERGIHVTDPGRTTRFLGGFRNADAAPLADSFSQTVDGDLMVAGRVEFHPMGLVPRHMADLNSLYDDKAWFFMVGLAGSHFSARVDGTGTFLGNVYHNEHEPGTRPAPPASGRLPVQADITHVTADGHFRWMGFSLNWAVHLRRVEFAARGQLSHRGLDQDPYATKGVQDFGATVDAGLFLKPDSLLVAARFSHVDFGSVRSRTPDTGEAVDGDAFGADSYEYGAGLTWFIRGDLLKLMADYRYVAQQLPHGRAAGGQLAGSKRTSDWRVFHEIRVQLQWLF
jgi:hypothetical protein